MMPASSHIIPQNINHDDENLNITGYNEHFSIKSWIKHIREEKLPPNNYKTIFFGYTCTQVFTVILKGLPGRF